MPKDDKVQTDEVSKETESTETETTGQEQTQTQPLSPEVQEAINKAATEAAKAATEAAKREIQSAKDKARAEVAQAQRDARYYQDLSGNYEKGFGQDDPERAELVRREAIVAAKEKADAELAQAQQREAFARSLNESLYTHLGALGIDPTDERIEWGQEETNYIKGRAKFDASVAKIIADDKKAAKEKVEEMKKDAESKANEEANSVDTAASGGAGTKDWRKLDPRDQISQGLKERQKKK